MPGSIDMCWARHGFPYNGRGAGTVPGLGLGKFLHLRFLNSAPYFFGFGAQAGLLFYFEVYFAQAILIDSREAPLSVGSDCLLVLSCS